MLRRTYILPIIDIMRRLIDFFLVMVLLSLHLRAENWMARLPDDALVADLSIPGAHDAATGSGWAGLNGPVGNLFAKTQDLDLLSLWQAGIRAFDLRPAVYKHHMNLNHGMMPTKLHLEDVLTMMQTWLRQNPSEFIIIHLLHAGDGDKVKEYYGKNIFEIDGDKIKEYCGKTLLEFDGEKLKRYCGPTIYEVDGNKIKEYCGKNLYEVEGFLSRREWMALLAILFAS